LLVESHRIEAPVIKEKSLGEYLLEPPEPPSHTIETCTKDPRSSSSKEKKNRGKKLTWRTSETLSV